LPKGHLWTKVSYFQQNTDEWYIASPQGFGDSLVEASTRQPYRFNGKYESKAVFIEAFYGVTERLDVGLQIPYFDQLFNDDTQVVPPSDAGFSDIRIFSKWRLLSKPFLLTLKGGVKMATGQFRNEDGLIPVGEGQWDFDTGVQVGRSFWPLPLYANAEVGYRFRLENKEIIRDPGDEWFFNAEVGYSITRKLLAAAKLEVLRGKAGTDFGFRNRSQIKRITYFNPVVSYYLYGGITAEVGARLSLGGRNFPAGQQLVIGLSSDVDVLKAVRAAPYRKSGKFAAGGADPR